MLIKKSGRLWEIGLALVILALVIGSQGLIVLGETQQQPPCTVTLVRGQSIQEAIDSAPDGAVICLEPGEWEENLVIEKSLTLRAAEIKAEPDVVIKSAKEGWPVILIKSDQGIEVRIEGLELTGASGLWAQGIEIRGHAKAVIQNNTISGNWSGIGMKDSSQATIQNNTISGNVDGILMADSSQAAIINNTISDNKWWYGIEMSSSSRATIENNTINGNKLGIEMGDHSQAAIANNTISGNWEDGIWMGGSSQATIQNNTIIDNVEGIEMVDSSQATIENNTIRGNVDGIGMGDSSQATIRDNKVFANYDYGVALLQGPCYDTPWKFTGKVEGSGNEIHDNGKGDVCPTELHFLTTQEGGCYGPECDGAR